MFRAHIAYHHKCVSWGITPPKLRDQTLSLLHPIHRLPGSVPLTVSTGRKRSSIHTVQYDAWSYPCLSGHVMRVPAENQITGLSKLAQFDFGGQASQGEGRPHDVPSHHNTGPRVSGFFQCYEVKAHGGTRYTCTIQEIPCFRVCRHYLPDSIHPLSCRMTWLWPHMLRLNMFIPLPPLGATTWPNHTSSAEGPGKELFDPMSKMKFPHPRCSHNSKVISLDMLDSSFPNICLAYSAGHLFSSNATGLRVILLSVCYLGYHQPAQT
jgi:hypothetical protein